MASVSASPSSGVPVSPGFVGHTSLSSLGRRAQIRDATLLRSVMDGARLSFARMASPEPVVRVEPVWEGEMQTVADAVDREIAEKVEAMRVSAVQLPDMDRVNALLQRFEVVPPKSAAPDLPNAEPVATATAEPVEPIKSVEVEDNAVDGASLAAALGDDRSELDGLSLDAEDPTTSISERSLDDLSDLAVTASRELDALVPDERVADQDASAVTEEGDELPAALAREPVGFAASKREPAQAVPGPAASYGPVTTGSAAAAVIGGVAELTGAAIAAPVKVLASAYRSINTARQQEVVRQKSFLRGGTLQSLTTHNVTGMEHAMADLRSAKEAMLAEPKISRVLSDIAATAQDLGKEPEAVFKDMRPGGRYEQLLYQWETAIEGSEGFSRFERIGGDLVRRMGRDQPKLANTDAALLKRYQTSIDDGIALTKGIPARRGLDNHMLETLHSKFSSFGDLLRKAFDKMRELVGTRSNSVDASPSPD